MKVALVLLLWLPGTMAVFGHIRLKDFIMAHDYVNLNHGSFGAVPQEVLANQTAWRNRVEQAPDIWYRYDMYTELDYVRAKLATYVGAEARDVVFVENASHGVNAVLRSLKLPAGRKILFLNCAYQMVKTTLSFLAKFANDQLLMVNITWPASADDIVATVAGTLKEHRGTIGAASFSHIVSLPAAILPVKRLVALCHQEDILVLVDGAHALGHIPINVTDLDADFYVANGHKWLYSPKGSAFLWVRADRQNLVYPTTISYEGQGISDFQIGFSYEGTSDMTAFAAMSAALTYRASLGDVAIMDYMHELAVQGGNILASQWSTELLLPTNMFAAMVDVRVPTNNTSCTAWLSMALLQRYHTWVPFYVLNSKVYVRVSAQIYNEAGDFHMLAYAVQSLLAEEARSAAGDLPLTPTA